MPGTGRFLFSVSIDLGFISASSRDMHQISTPTESKVPVKQAIEPHHRLLSAKKP